ncbi:MAG: EAL domain-containing protein [Alphaproteobacteria bacterium]|nr:EAL domain-containing protein [Alphaproteobacteria bacterium]
MLKIDGNIIGDVVNDPVQQTIVAGIVAVAGKMDVRVVAEFVADEHMQKPCGTLGQFRPGLSRRPTVPLGGGNRHIRGEDTGVALGRWPDVLKCYHQTRRSRASV